MEREEKGGGKKGGSKERREGERRCFGVRGCPLPSSPFSLFMELVLAGRLLWFLRSGHSRFLTIERLLGLMGTIFKRQINIFL